MCSSLHGRLEQTLTISNNRKMFKHCFQHRHRKNRFRNTSTQKSIESVIYLAQEQTFRWIFLQLSMIETSDRHGSVCRTRMRFLADSYQLVSRVSLQHKKSRLFKNQQTYLNTNTIAEQKLLRVVRLTLMHLRWETYFPNG